MRNPNVPSRTYYYYYYHRHHCYYFLALFSVPGQLTASKVALFWPAALRCASRAVQLCGSNGTANG